MTILERTKNNFILETILLEYLLNLKRPLIQYITTSYLKNVDYYGIRVVAKDWFCSYLNNQKLHVILNGSNSHIKPILTGVQPESLLGSLVFLIYNNNLCKYVKYFQTYHFDDDTNMLQTHSSLETLVK